VQEESGSGGCLEKVVHPGGGRGRGVVGGGVGAVGQLGAADVPLHALGLLLQQLRTLVQQVVQELVRILHASHFGCSSKAGFETSPPPLPPSHPAAVGSVQQAVRTSCAFCTPDSRQKSIWRILLHL